MSKFVKLSFVLSFILGMSAIAFGQSTVTGAIGGVVANPNKEVVPNAAVTVRNTETNKEDSATTDDQGRFKVAGLQPGSYSVTINGAGFSPYTQEKVLVEVGRETTLNAALSIGPLAGGTVEVTSEAPVINTSQQDFSTNINQTSINELPINGRRWSNFALLTPGAVPDGVFGLISFRASMDAPRAVWSTRSPSQAQTSFTVMRSFTFATNSLTLAIRSRSRLSQMGRSLRCSRKTIANSLAPQSAGR